MTSGVYSITNLNTGKRYIGSAVDIDARWRLHLSYLRRDKHHSRHLQNAWNRDGEKAFCFDVIAVCEPANLTELEQHHIDAFRATDRRYGYNVRLQAQSNLGLNHTAEAKAKIAASNKEFYNSPESKIRNSGIMRRLWERPGFRERVAESRRFISQKSRRGELSSSAKLTENDVRDIRRRIAKGEKQKDIAALYMVAQTTVSSIKTGSRWSHVK